MKDKKNKAATEAQTQEGYFSKKTNIDERVYFFVSYIKKILFACFDLFWKSSLSRIY